MWFSAICFSRKYLLIRDISGKSEKTVQQPFKHCLLKGALNATNRVVHVPREVTLIAHANGED